MCANPNMTARPSLLSKITDIGDDFPPFLVAPAAQKFVLRIRRAALMQTTVLAVTCSILTAGLGSSPARADVTLEERSNGINFTEAGVFDGFSGLEDHGDNTLLSAHERTLDLGANSLEVRPGGAFEVSAGQQLSAGNGIILRRDHLIVTNPGAGVDVTDFALYAQQDEPLTLRIANGGVARLGDRPRGIDHMGHFWLEQAFTAGPHQAELEIGGFRDVAQNQGFKIEAWFNF